MKLHELRRRVFELDRIRIRQLAQRIGVDREALADFAEVGAELPPEPMAALWAWAEVDVIRRALGREVTDRRSEAERATGVHHQALGDFIAGSDLPPADLALVQAWVRGEFARTATSGDGYVRTTRPEQPVLHLGAPPADWRSPERQRRDELLAIAANLPLDDLERALLNIAAPRAERAAA